MHGFTITDKVSFGERTAARIYYIYICGFVTYIYILFIFFLMSTPSPGESAFIVPIYVASSSSSCSAI